MSYSDKNPAWDRMHKTRHVGDIEGERIQRISYICCDECGRASYDRADPDDDTNRFCNTCQKWTRFTTEKAQP